MTQTITAEEAKRETKNTIKRRLFREKRKQRMREEDESLLKGLLQKTIDGVVKLKAPEYLEEIYSKIRSTISEEKYGTGEFLIDNPTNWKGKLFWKSIQRDSCSADVGIWYEERINRQIISALEMVTQQLMDQKFYAHIRGNNSPAFPEKSILVGDFYVNNNGEREIEKLLNFKSAFDNPRYFMDIRWNK